MKAGSACSRQGNCRARVCYSSKYACVDDAELVLRMIFSPYHIKKGKITVGAFSFEQLTKMGVSVNRQHLLTIEKYSDLVCRMDNREGRTFAGVAQLHANEIRNISNLMICPSGNQENPSHADILTQTEIEDKEFLDQIRRELVSICNLMPLEAIFSE